MATSAADAVLALGIAPIAMAKVSYMPGDIQTWTKAGLSGRTPKLLGADTDTPLEEVTYQRGAGVDTWQDSTLLIGKALGRERNACAHRRHRGPCDPSAPRPPRFRGQDGDAVQLLRRDGVRD